MAQPQLLRVRPKYMLEILQRVVPDYHLAPLRSLDLAHEVGLSNMEQEHIEALRKEFTLVEEIDALRYVLSEENFAAYEGTRPLQAANNGGNQANSNALNAADQDMLSLKSGAPCCWLQFRGGHTPACTNYQQGQDGWLRYVSLVGSSDPTGERKGGLRGQVRPCCKRQPNGKHSLFCINYDRPELVWDEPTFFTPKFEFFTKLSPELRTTIYELALSNNAPIAPQLCSRGLDGRVQFHDANQHSRQKPNHIAIARLLGVTQVSKQIREESLPCFYSANTFSITSDTPTYFAYLEYLNRFHLIRHVQLNIPKLKDYFAPQILAQMKSYMADVEKYEKTNTPLSPSAKGKAPATSKIVALSPYDYFVGHPRYTTGGLQEVGLMICVSMLSSSSPPSTFPSPSTPPLHPSTSHLVLPVPHTSTFTAHPVLTWFASVLHGLGIQLHLIPDKPLTYHVPGNVGILWEQKFQKSDFKLEGMEGCGKQVEKRVKEMWPDLGEDAGMFWARTSYLRSSCDGMEHVWWEANF